MIRTSYSVEGLIRNTKDFVFLMNLSTEKCMASSSLRHIFIIPLEPKTSGQLLGKNEFQKLICYVWRSIFSR